MFTKDDMREVALHTYKCTSCGELLEVDGAELAFVRKARWHSPAFAPAGVFLLSCLQLISTCPLVVSLLASQLEFRSTIALLRPDCDLSASCPHR